MQITDDERPAKEATGLVRQTVVPISNHIEGFALAVVAWLELRHRITMTLIHHGNTCWTTVSRPTTLAWSG
jgi:hypothetical protein